MFNVVVETPVSPSPRPKEPEVHVPELQDVVLTPGEAKAKQLSGLPSVAKGIASIIAVQTAGIGREKPAEPVVPAMPVEVPGISEPAPDIPKPDIPQIIEKTDAAQSAPGVV